MPLLEGIRKVLVLGSGGIKIGEAGEFDYSGSQCLKAIREEGVQAVLVNPNVATIQTDTRLADKVYLLPVTPSMVARVIEQERPDGIMLSFGGQTALNCGVALKRQGILERYGIRVLGTSVEAIETASDRELFKQTMRSNGIEIVKGKAAHSMDEALAVVRELGYPVMIRVAFTLGGKGSGIAHNEYELHEIVQRGLAASMIHQVMLEEYIGHWKQIEYEVMRDYKGNSITVCNMENILAMRVHTGDNMVIAPSQTINNHEYHMLRSIGIRAVEACKVVGECNIQFALEPTSERYAVIEINPRLSRSSALASKATGYPLAYMAAKIALGYTLDELLNRITKMTTACFEPSLDYVVVKVPRWDFRKFDRANRKLGTQMKSVGEVMAVARTFEEAIQKAYRMLDIGLDGVLRREPKRFRSEEELEDAIMNPDDEILLNVVDALRLGWSVERISRLTPIDPWFIYRLKNIVDMENRLKSLKELDEDTVREAKRLGFSDRQIARCLNIKEEDVRRFRKGKGIVPVVKQIDTLAAEWPAKTNYLYMTYGGVTDDVLVSGTMQGGDGPDESKEHEYEYEHDGNGRVMVLGAGTYRIGSSVEFDWATVNMIWGLKDHGFREVAVVNCNPETVSTDYDVSDRLYFEELTLERVLDIYEKENPAGIVTCVGGQVANNLTPRLAMHGARILGTGNDDLDRAEDRAKFSALLDALAIKQPAWQEFTSIEKAKEFCRGIGYPVLVRPSYVLSGSAMRVIWDESNLEHYLNMAAEVSPEHPVVISKFITDALEVEVDGVADGSNVLIGAIIEHVESAGTHSGDAMMVIPPWRLSSSHVQRLREYTHAIARALRIRGPFNIQYIVKGDDVYVIECNVRASRSMPYVSKFTGVNLITLAAGVIAGKALPEIDEPWLNAKGFAVKVPQFSFMQLEGADIVLGVEMKSTGEVACFGDTFYDALSKALMAAGYTLTSKNAVLITVGGAMKRRILPMVSALKAMNLKIYATEHTAEFLIENGFRDVHTVYKISEPNRKPNIADLLHARALDFIINVPGTLTIEKYAEMLEDEYMIRRKAVEMGIPVFTNLDVANLFIKTLEWLKGNEPTISPLQRYII
ncbi:MAG: carbamoyl-phosphate synthase (glutamine-hydrolyzing) large subunit [Candidatus Nitrosocaldus sp.]|nr:carbamoyl-phosphate synthase (glutamine-hydrolyzing) large subunit [Candidatus Nitrosocaldus sp.]MDW8000503.1 carbamoyl-phosphate synthase (glutamine-hydrolyzing) large subunit [Candidatus Nitrosocaldus sp.]